MLNESWFNIIKSVVLVGFFVFSVSCFVNCHNGNMVLLWLFRTIIKNDHSNKLSVKVHNNHIIIVQGIGGIKGWDLILQTVYPSSLLYSCAVEYFSCWTLLAWINAGELLDLWTHILLSCPAIYTIHLAYIWYTHIKRLLAGYKLNIAEYSWILAEYKLNISRL